jgi:hypothetical protein
VVVEKVVRKFNSFQEADEATLNYYASLTPEQRLQLLLDLIMPEDPNEGTIQRSVRIYPLTEHS